MTNSKTAIIALLCLVVGGCSSDARMSALKSDMATQQAVAETAASRPDATEEDKERARGYASAQSCMDQMQAHSRAVQTSHTAALVATAGLSLAGPGGALAARALAPVQGIAMQNRGGMQVACY